MRVVLNDFAGHPFTLSLAETLQEMTVEVDYAFCVSNSTPHADFDSASVLVSPLSSGRSFEKYGVVRRIVAELLYGLNSARQVLRLKPQEVVMNNTPILSLLPVWLACRVRRARYTVWLQDVQSGLVAGVKGDKSAASRAAAAAEGFALRRADRVVAISEPLAQATRAFGVRPDNVRVLPNWAPVEGLDAGSQTNPWSVEHDLAGHTVLLYSGTLAKKHTPDLLLALADGLPDAIVVVVSSGDGADALAAAQAQLPRPNLRLFPFQPFDRLNEVLATATVLIVLLTDEASGHSVPSKVLSYLAAERPVLASMPVDNPAATLVADEAQAGFVVPPGDVDRLVECARELLDDSELSGRMARSGRRFAEQHFARDVVAKAFLEAAGIRLPAVDAS